MGSLNKLIGLPLEIQDLIFHYLDKVEDKLNLAKVDKVFEAAFKHHCRNKFETLDVEKVRYRLWPVLLSLCGETVLNINVVRYENILPPFEYIERYCPNLRFIRLYLKSRNRGVVRNFMRNMPSVRHLDICVINASSKLLRFLQDLPNLEKVRILNRFGSECDVLMTTWFDDISLEDYPAALPKPINLHTTFAPLKNLKFLELRGLNLCYTEDNEESSFPALAELRIHYCAIISDLPRFAKLTSLCVVNPARLDDQNKWVLKHTVNSEKWMLRLDDTIVVDIIRRLQNLLLCPSSKN